MASGSVRRTRREKLAPARACHLASHPNRNKTPLPIVRIFVALLPRMCPKTHNRATATVDPGVGPGEVR